MDIVSHCCRLVDRLLERNCFHILLNLPIYSPNKIFENILSVEMYNHNVKVLYSTFGLLTQRIMKDKMRCIYSEVYRPPFCFMCKST